MLMTRNPIPTPARFDSPTHRHTTPKPGRPRGQPPKRTGVVSRLLWLPAGPYSNTPSTEKHCANRGSTPAVRPEKRPPGRRSDTADGRATVLRIAAVQLRRLDRRTGGHRPRAQSDCRVRAARSRPARGAPGARARHRLRRRLVRELRRAVVRRACLRPDKTYARLIGSVFIDGKKNEELIEPGSTSSTCLFSWNTATTDAMAAGGQSGHFIVAGRKRPFLIAGGTIVSTRRDYEYPLLMPVEYTPLYVGVRPGRGRRSREHTCRRDDSRAVRRCAPVHPGRCGGQ